MPQLAYSEDAVSGADPIDLVARRVMIFMGKVQTSQNQGLIVAASKAIENAAASAAELGKRNRTPVENWADSFLPQMTIPQIKALIRLHNEPNEGLSIHVFQNYLREESLPKKAKAAAPISRAERQGLMSMNVMNWFDVIGVHAIGLDKAGWWFSLNAKDRKWASDKAGRKMKELREASENERPLIIKKAVEELKQKRLAAKKQGDTSKGVHSDVQPDEGLSGWSEAADLFEKKPPKSKPKAKAKPLPKAAKPKAKHDHDYSKGIKDALSKFDMLLTEVNETCPYAYEVLQTIRSHLPDIEKKLG
jgi:hypothetical protein